MADYIDVTLPLSEQLPVWPTSERFRLIPEVRIADGGNANTSGVCFNLHTGTHIDAPWHFIADGATVDQLSLTDLIGPAYVAHLPGIKAVTDDVLDELDLPSGSRRLLLRTDNSDLWRGAPTEFEPDFVALTPGAARWVVDHGIRLIGVDYLSVQCFHDADDATHQILLRDHVVVVEGLNLGMAPAGIYDLICLPISIAGAEAAPARVLLREVEH